MLQRPAKIEALDICYRRVRTATLLLWGIRDRPNTDLMEFRGKSFPFTVSLTALISQQ